MRIQVAVAAVALAVAGCTSTPSADTVPIIAPNGPGEAARTLSPGDIGTDWKIPPNEADLSYVVGMIGHHRQAVEMTALVPERATNEVVRGLAARIHDTQGPEIKAMEQWQRQYATEAPAHGHSSRLPHVDHASMPGMATPEQMGALKATTGSAFDRLFLDLMVRHHEGALKMAETVLADGSDVHVELMATDVISGQSAEIKRMLAVSIP